MRHAMVYVNDELAGNRSDGYARFWVDATPFLREGANELRVEVRTGEDSRWYSGAGLHRSVVLHVDELVHVGPEGVTVTKGRVEEGKARVEGEKRGEKEEERTATAVSYTHLDVYKRQERTLREVAAAASAVHQGAPLAVEFTLTGESQLRLRPLVWGKSGKWIKSGITWDALAYDYRSSYLAAHRRALLTLGRALDGDGTLGRYYHGASDVRSLADAGPTVWSALEHAASVGVVFVSANGTPPVRLAASPASLVVEIMEADDGVEIVRRFACLLYTSRCV